MREADRPGNDNQRWITTGRGPIGGLREQQHDRRRGHTATGNRVKRLCGAGGCHNETARHQHANMRSRNREGQSRKEYTGLGADTTGGD